MHSLRGAADIDRSDAVTNQSSTRFGIAKILVLSSKTPNDPARKIKRSAQLAKNAISLTEPSKK